MHVSFCSQFFHRLPLSPSVCPSWRICTCVCITRTERLGSEIVRKGGYNVCVAGTCFHVSINTWTMSTETVLRANMFLCVLFIHMKMTSKERAHALADKLACMLTRIWASNKIKCCHVYLVDKIDVAVAGWSGVPPAICRVIQVRAGLHKFRDATRILLLTRQNTVWIA